MKHKVITRGARAAVKIGGEMGRRMKRAAWRAYRRRVKAIDHVDETANYEPPRQVRVTDYDVI